MRTLLAAAVLSSLLSVQAVAWDNTNTGSGQIVDGGSGSQSKANAHAKSQSTATATGVGVGIGGAGGGGGRGYGGGAVVTNAVGGSARAPDVVLPSIGGGGMDCPTVGFGAGGSGLGGGGGLGPSWISSDCNARKLAEILMASGHQTEALMLLRKHFSEVDAVFASEAAAVPFKPSPWCAGATTYERRRNPGSCGP